MRRTMADQPHVEAGVFGAPLREGDRGVDPGGLVAGRAATQHLLVPRQCARSYAADRQL